MGSEWAEVELGGVVDIHTGYPFKSRDYTEDEDGIKLVRGDNVVQGKLRWSGVKRWPLRKAKDLSCYKLEVGDVVLAMDRPWIEAGLKYAELRKYDLPALLVQRVARLRGKARLHTRFLKYLIGSYSFTHHVLAVQTGTAVPHISASQIKEFTFRLPPLPEQKAIAHVLGSLDDRIELNRRMNETLEGMAQALFKSWFVDFDPVLDNAIASGKEIPPELKEKAAARSALGDNRRPLPKEIRTLFPNEFTYNDELGWIPKGWEVKQLDEIANYQNGLALQKFRPENVTIFLPIVKIAQLRAGVATSEEKASPDINPACVIDNGDIVFSWSGTLMVDIWCGGKAALNQHLFKVTSKEYPKWFYYYWTKHHLSVFQRIATDKAVTMGHIKRSHLKEAFCAVPNFDLEQITLFSGLVEKQIKHRMSNRSLTKLRDTLLPKLLSGEIRIPDAEKMVEGIKG